MVAMLKPIAPFVEYAINKDYIAEFLCINKDKPEMACGGKCHLMKQLEQQEEEQPAQLRIAFEEYPIGFVKVYEKNVENDIEHVLELPTNRPPNYTYLFSPEIFHPPAA